MALLDGSLSRAREPTLRTHVAPAQHAVDGPPDSAIPTNSGDPPDRHQISEQMPPENLNSHKEEFGASAQ